MTESKICTCPSGDGSLRWPCPAHPAVDQADVAAKLTFINGRPAMCGCQVEYSDGGGEYSDVIYVTLCAKHSGSAILDLVATNRIALTPEYEGQWHADLYLDREIPLAKVEGATPAEAVLALMSAERIDPEQESVEQAGGDERVIGWRERILAAHPNSDPGFWTDALLVEHMAAEIEDLRAALAQPSPAHELDPLGLAPHAEAFNEAPDEALRPEQAEAERPELWAVHAQGPDELYAAFTREDAEKHAAELNALPMPEGIAVGAVVVPSPWPAVQHWQYLAEQEQDHKNEIAGRLRQLERICEGLAQDAIDGGWNVQGIRGYAKRLEDQLKAALARVAELETKLAELEKQEPVAWGAFHFGGKRDGKLYTHCETEAQIEAYILDMHRSSDSLTLRKGPLYGAPVTQAQHSVPGDIMRDAQRYRWLRDQQFYFSFSTENSDAGISSCTAGMSSRFKNLSWVDAAIDSAIAAAPGKEVGHE
ncbi:hypothetical protein ACIRT4_16825 [Pseudomonas aeruginosa]|uniref:hypothetical protein n=1 Tax=Pseudomonas aeruginosa TaxID=287 RepID=UPI003D9B8E5B